MTRGSLKLNFASPHRRLSGIRGDLALLAWITLVHAWTCWVWLRASHLEVAMYPDHFLHVAGLEQTLVELELFGLAGMWRNLLATNGSYSMVAHYPLALFGLNQAVDPGILRMVNLFYFVLMVGGLYWLGRLCHGRVAGLLAVALASLMPAVYGGWRTVGLDFPGLCLSPLAMVALLRSDGFTRTGPALGFGAVCGWLMLVRPQALLFLFWPAAMSLGRTAWRLRAAPRRLLHGALARALAALVMLALVSAPFWLGHGEVMLAKLGGNISGLGMEGFERDPSLLYGMYYYIVGFPLLMGGPLALGTLLLWPRFWRRSRHALEVALWIGPGLLLHVLSALRNVRYLFPMAPALALVLGVSVASLRPGLRGWVAASLALPAAALWLLCSLLPGSPLPCSSRTRQADLSTNALALPTGPVEWLSTCGAGFLAHVPISEKETEGYQVAGDIARWLGDRHPGGGGALLLVTSPGADQMQVAVTLRRALPMLRTLLVMNAGQVTEQLPVGRFTYYLLRLDKPPHREWQLVWHKKYPPGGPPAYRVYTWTGTVSPPV